MSMRKASCQHMHAGAARYKLLVSICQMIDAVVLLSWFAAIHEAKHLLPKKMNLFAQYNRRHEQLHSKGSGALCPFCMFGREPSSCPWHASTSAHLLSTGSGSLQSSLKLKCSSKH